MPEKWLMGGSGAAVARAEADGSGWTVSRVNRVQPHCQGLVVLCQGTISAWTITFAGPGGIMAEYV